MIPQSGTRKMLLLTGASVSALMMSSTAVVAQVDDYALEEIVVTATKRNESIQDVPLAITSFDANTTKRLNIGDVKELIRFAPGMAGDTQDSFLDFVNVRGISTNDFGNGGDPSIGLFKNNLYQGRTGSAVSSFFDIDRAEVLRGPQGFLFGRNAISGAISFHTARPRYDETSGSVDVEVGERGILNGEAVLNMPISDDIAMRAAVFRSHENGYIGNVAHPNDDKIYGNSKWAGRLSTVMKGESWDAFFMAEYEDKTGSGTAYVATDSFSVAGEAGAATSGISAMEWISAISGVDTTMPDDARMINSDNTYGNDDHSKVLSFSAEINVDLDWATWTSTTGFKDHEYAYSEDYDGMPVQFYDYAQQQEGDYFEQEFKLVSQGDGPFSWYAGVSYYKEHIYSEFQQGTDENIVCGAYYQYINANYPNYMTDPTRNCSDMGAYWGYGADYYSGTPQHNNEGNATRGTFSGWGAYVSGTYEITDKFDVEAGVRYSSDKKDFGINVHPVDGGLGHWNIFAAGTSDFVDDTKTWTDYTPRFIARYKATEDMMVYGSVTKGFKAGGFNSFGIRFRKDSVRNNGNAAVARPDFFDPETVWSYEMGIKGTSEDKRVRYDVNAYFYKYQDMQLNHWVPGSGGKVSNVGKVKSSGLEGSVQIAISENWDMLAAGSYNKNSVSEAELIEPDSDGNRLSGAPKYKASGMISYHTPITDTGELNISADVSASTSYFASGLANSEAAKLNGFSDIALRVGYEDDAGWSVTAYVENLFSTVYYDGGYESSFPLPHVKFGVSRPRTFGLKLSYSWGE